MHSTVAKEDQTERQQTRTFTTMLCRMDLAGAKKVVKRVSSLETFMLVFLWLFFLVEEAFVHVFAAEFQKKCPVFPSSVTNAFWMDIFCALEVRKGCFF